MTAQLASRSPFALAALVFGAFSWGSLGCASPAPALARAADEAYDRKPPAAAVPRRNPVQTESEAVAEAAANPSEDPCPGRAHEPGAKPTSVATKAPLGASGSQFWCFSWVHGRLASVDCFRGRGACVEAEREMSQAHRSTRPCERTLEASCTKLEGYERCFESLARCEHFLSRRACDHPWTACTQSK